MIMPVRVNHNHSLLQTMACLHGGEGPWTGEVSYPGWLKPPVHQSLILIMFTWKVG